MWVFVTIALVWLGPSAAAAGPISVKVETGHAEREPFLVMVSGHYASIHNGTSKHWKDALVPDGSRRLIALGPVNPLLNMGVSVTIYHPAYVVERERSYDTPSLLSPVSFETFRPRPWRDALTPGYRFSNQGGDRALLQAVGHLQLFIEAYLPTVDDEGGVPAAVLQSYVSLFEEIVAFALDEPPLELKPSSRGAEYDRSLARNMAKLDLEQEVRLEDLLYRTREWLSIAREQRVAVRGLMAAMRYPKTVGEELLTASDVSVVNDLLDRYAEASEARREPDPVVSWINPDNRVSFRARVLDRPRQCARLSIKADLTTVVSADLGDMTNEVTARFCRTPEGVWRYGTT